MPVMTRSADSSAATDLESRFTAIDRRLAGIEDRLSMVEIGLQESRKVAEERHEEMRSQFAVILKILGSPASSLSPQIEAPVSIATSQANQTLLVDNQKNNDSSLSPLKGIKDSKIVSLENAKKKDEEVDLVSTSTLAIRKTYLNKLELPNFDGTDAHTWLSIVECFFSMCKYTDTEKLKLVSMGLSGRVLIGFDWEVSRAPFKDWHDFMDKFLLHFGRSIRGPRMARLHNFVHEDSVEDYVEALRKYKQNIYPLCTYGFIKILPSIIKACSFQQESFLLGQQLHGLCLKSGVEFDYGLRLAKVIHGFLFHHVVHSNDQLRAFLVTVFCRGGDVNLSRLVFDTSNAKDVVLWSSMISGSADIGDCSKAVIMISQMRTEESEDNSVTLLVVVSTCTHLASLNFASTNNYVGLVEVAISIFTQTGFVSMPYALNMSSKHGHAAYCNHYWENQLKKGYVLEFRCDSKMMSIMCSHNQMNGMFSKCARESTIARCTKKVCNNDGFIVTLTVAVHAGLELRFKNYCDETYAVRRVLGLLFEYPYNNFLPHTVENVVLSCLAIDVGGFGKVYRGELEVETIIAIKRATPHSQQRSAEFETEIVMQSKLWHRHQVSLIRFCHEHNLMILIYKYMANESLRSHLFGSNFPQLSWNQQLEAFVLLQGDFITFTQALREESFTEMSRQQIFY